MHHTNSKRKIILFFFIFILTASACGLALLYSRYYKISYVSESFSETKDELMNPYRGWYNIYGYMLNDSDTYNEQSILSSFKNDKNTRLSLIEINLKNYRDTKISFKALNQLNLIFNAVSKTNKSLIVRFLYDWDGNAVLSEPQSMDTITTHMEQVSTIINSHKKSIYTMQGIFVGNCGEMNNSKYMSDDNMTKLMNKLTSVIDKDIFLAVRTPSQYRTITNTLCPIPLSDSFNKSIKSRIGLFNDGMLGSNNDLGTYGDTKISRQNKPSDKLKREDEIDFQNIMCRYVPNGGEVVIDNTLNNIDNAIVDLNNMHVSYLNNLHDLSVINKWKKQTYTGNGVFNGVSAYDYIGEHLGYRYVLSSSSLKFDTFNDENASLQLKISNSGFANCYKKFNVSVHVINNKTSDDYIIPVNCDTRKWYSNNSCHLSVPLNIRKYSLGSYSIYITVKDPDNDEIIKFANNGYTKYGYKIGSFTVSK